MIRKKYVKPMETEQELARLAITYLCFPQISSQLSSDTVKDAVLAGSYSFYEYAVACWVPHLLTWLHKLSEGYDIHELAEELEVLLELHYSSPHKLHVISKTMHDKLQGLSGFRFYDNLAQAIVFSQRQLANNEVGVSDTETLRFPAITTHIRSEIEQLQSTDEQIHATLKKYHGTNLFKCRYLSCQYFYKGFNKRLDRDRHLERHDRAYNCTFEGCPTATFGCVSKNDLDKHMLESHGVVSEDPDFPDIKNTRSSRVQEQPSNFQCSLCPKRFTRKHNLTNHKRTHEDERPHQCATCGKAFTRKSDRDRHQRSHGGNYVFVCRGTLENGDQWGCDKHFSRADTLKSHHFDRVARYDCIRPMLEEQLRLRKAAEQGPQAGDNSPSSESQPFDADNVGSSQSSLPSQGSESCLKQDLIDEKEYDRLFDSLVSYDDLGDE